MVNRNSYKDWVNFGNVSELSVVGLVAESGFDPIEDLRTQALSDLLEDVDDNDCGGDADNL